MSMTALAMPVPQMVAGSLAIVLNAVTLGVFSRTRTVKASTVYLNSYLAVSDICLGLCVIVRSALAMTHALTWDVCVLLLDVIITSAGGSLTALLLLHLEVYLSVSHPLRCRAVFTKPRAVAVIAGSVLLWTGVGVLGYALTEEPAAPAAGEEVSMACLCFPHSAFSPAFLIGLCSAYLFMFAVILVCQLSILRLFRRHQAKVRAQLGRDAVFMVAAAGMTAGGAGVAAARVTAGGAGLAAGGAGVAARRAGVTAGGAVVATRGAGQAASGHRSAWIQRKLQLSKLLTVILLLFLVCWYPYIIATLVYNACPSCSINPEALANLGSLILLHGVLNIFVYIAKSQEFRAVLMCALCYCCHRTPVTEVTRSHTPNRVGSAGHQ